MLQDMFFIIHMIWDIQEENWTLCKTDKYTHLFLKAQLLFSQKVTALNQCLRQFPSDWLLEEEKVKTEMLK